MKRIYTLLLVAFFALTGFSQTGGSKISTIGNKIKVADDVTLIKLSDKAYMHISYADVPSFGKVAGNGLLLVDDGKAFLFDTPWDNVQTEKLVTWVADSLHAKVTTFVPNHWHGDCIGGLAYLQQKGVKSYANQITIDIAKEKGLPVPQTEFKDSLTLKLNDIEVDCYYLGGGHATDNIVVWVPSMKILFPGCMVKDMVSTTLGNLSDADIPAWPVTIRKVIEKFPSVEIVIPGHGRSGGKELLMHTLELLTSNRQ